MSSCRNKTFPVIMGPTASGKTELAVRLARITDGEVISADSMQVYRGLVIGTAKPSAEEQGGVPHHLINVVDITEKYDVYRFRDDAEHLIAAIRDSGKLPVIAGGTGLYLRALLYGLDSLPASAELRGELDGKYDNEERFPELQELMKKESPEDYAKFGQHRRKLIRAREVFLLTGTPMTRLQQTWKKAPCREDARSFVLVWDNAVLRDRIARRCRNMLAQGWIEEAEQFIRDGLHDSPTAWQALGYRQIADYLNGSFQRSELEEKIITATWQFARRQNTWFRTQHPEARPILMPSDSPEETILRELR